MNSPLTARLLGLAVVSLFASMASAQQPMPEAPPVPAEPGLAEAAAQVLDAVTEPAPPAAVVDTPPVADAMPAEPVAPAPAADAVMPEEAVTEEGEAADALAPPPEPTAADATFTGEPKRILVMPLEFTVYERSVAGLEAVPDWTEAARRNLLEAAGSMLRADRRFEIVAVPPVEGDAQDVLREHVELFKIISDTVTGVVNSGGKAWEEKKTNFDYTLGDGLAFLADASGADYAFILGGSQVKPTGGTTFMQLLAAGAGVYVAGGGTYVAAGIVDLRTGNVTWLNSMQGGEIFGMTTNDTRKPEAATAILAKMFEGYPNTRWVTIRPF